MTDLLILRMAAVTPNAAYTVLGSDGRILFGGRGAPYRFGSPIREEFDRHDSTHAMLRDMARMSTSVVSKSGPVKLIG